MTDAQHTPGPLHFQRVSEHDRGSFALYDDAGRWLGDANDFPRYGISAEANARLWAAAPDLLAALEEIAKRGTHPSYCPAYMGGGECRCHTGCVWCRFHRHVDEHGNRLSECCGQPVDPDLQRCPQCQERA